MNRLIRWALPVIAALSLAGATYAAGVKPGRARIRLFNGKDLTGFYSFLRSKGKNNDPDRVFSVVDGAIRASGEEFGYVATVDEYENFRLTAEFRWGEKTFAPRVANARDSGILFHMIGPDKVWPHSIEFQIIEGGTGDVLMVDGASMAYEAALGPRLASKDVLSPDGKRIVKGRVNWAKRAPAWKDVLGFHGPDDIEKPTGQWNVLELVCHGDAFTYKVNGVLVVEGKGASPTKGRLVFQSEGAEIFFRRLELSPLR